MKEDVYQLRATQLGERITSAWRSMHHNASISKHYPDFRNEYEGEMFWDWLSDAVCHECDRLETLIEQKFGITTKVYSAGRQGATIYPEIFHASIGGNGFGRFDWSYFHRNFESDRAELKERERVAKFLEWFNAHWHRQASKVPRQWNAYKRRANLSKTIRSYDGLSKRTITVWG